MKKYKELLLLLGLLALLGAIVYAASDRETCRDSKCPPPEASARVLYQVDAELNG